MNENKPIGVIAIFNKYKTKELHQIQEFISLILAAGYEYAFIDGQSIETPNTATYLGSGFVEHLKEIVLICQEKYKNEFQEIIIATNFDLSGTQRASLKKALKVEVVDRSFVILKIFENNAHSKEAKLQVDIASLTWSKNHLVNREGAFSQVTSGGGMHNKGSGEKQIALDRRHIDQLINAKKNELEKIKVARKNSRTRRNNSGIYKIAIVGYTNAGKSTLMNSFNDFANKDKDVLEKNQLFATLQTSTREFSKYGYMRFLLTDTVGFVSDLPTTLVEAFKTTLEEITEADLLIHVVDISNPNYAEQINVTSSVLGEIGVDNIPTVYLYNKYDILEKPLDRLLDDNMMYTSLKVDLDMDEIYNFICQNLSKDWKEVSLELPFDFDYGKFAADNYVLTKMKNKNGYQVTVKINPRTEYKYRYLIDKNS